MLYIFVIGRAWSYCKYSGEKVSYSLNEERCNSYGGTVCDAERIFPYGQNQTCGLGIPNWLPSFRWTNQTCTVQVKVDNAGMISIVHDPNLDINTVLQSKGETLQSIHQPVSPDNNNYFKVKWNQGQFPSALNQCGSCQQLGNNCLCEVSVSEDKIFSQVPKANEALKKLTIGSPHPDFYDKGYQLVSETNGVQLYLVPEDNPKITKRAIFGVWSRGQLKYYRNIKSEVSIANGEQSYTFRNPPSFLSIIEQKTSDAYYETEAVLDHYIYHPNTAPFIATLMIKRLVTSNPSNSYVKRAANAFKKGLYEIEGIAFGDGVHGNLEALFAAILLDDEARSSVLDADPTFGSLKEPLVKLIGFMRAMEFQQNTRVPALRMSDLITKVGQEPFATPNVFSCKFTYFA